MLSIGSLVFTNPWILSALALVPLAYFIIRAIPPAPRRMFFPATWLTRQLNSETTTSQAAPWWLLLLRLLMLTLLILALAGPSLSRIGASTDSGPVALMIDNDWSAAADWEARSAVVQEMLSRFNEAGRSVAIVPTAPPIGGWPEGHSFTFLNAGESAQRLAALQPVPWVPDYEAATRHIKALAEGKEASIQYFTNGINHGNAGPFLSAANAAAPMEITALKQASLRQLAIANVRPTADGFEVLVIRKDGERALSLTVVITDTAGTLLASKTAEFGADQSRVDVRLAVPALLRARVAQLRIEAARHAGATYVFDARAQRPMVGIVDSQNSLVDQPLQTPYYYLSRALQPFATLERGDVDTLLASGASILLLPDQARLPLAEEDAVLSWLRAGGTVLRFSGPNLFAGDDLQDDALLPTRLRPEPRVVGGALSWSAAQPLAPFDENSPFYGVAIAQDIRIEKQALVRSGSAQQAKVWAKLADGTPLVTASTFDSGTLVLFHTSANASWSNLALSGTFVEMLQRLLQIGVSRQSAGTGPSDMLVLTKMLNASGQLVPASDRFAPIARAQLDKSASGPAQPPGIYEGARTVLAMNLAANAGPLTPRTQLRAMEDAAGALPYRLIDGPQERSFIGLLLMALFILAIIDVVATLLLHANPGTRFAWPKALRRTAATLAALSAISVLWQSEAVHAQEASPSELAENVRLACIVTGDSAVNALCTKGLDSLSRQLNLRTSVWTGAAQSIDPLQDDLGLYPLLYWPILQDAAALPQAAYTRLNSYLQSGGMIIMDLGVKLPGQARMDVTLPAQDVLARIRRNLTVPPLAMLTKEHVLTHSFYILKSFPGRRGNASVWVEAGGEAIGADVSPIIVGAADWLTAWSNAQTSLPGYASGDARGTELAVRFGINAVMYALTGTYKADQVHLPALLERVEREE